MEAFQREGYKYKFLYLNSTIMLLLKSKWWHPAGHPSGHPLRFCPAQLQQGSYSVYSQIMLAWKLRPEVRKGQARTKHHTYGPRRNGKVSGARCKAKVSKSSCQLVEVGFAEEHQQKELSEGSQQRKVWWVKEDPSGSKKSQRGLHGDPQRITKVLLDLFKR